MKLGNMDVYGIIYKIENLINGKVYIGQTTMDNGFNDRYNYRGKKDSIERVYNYHRTLYEANNPSCNKHLLHSIKKYGVDKFAVVTIFDVAFSKNELDIKEECWISSYDSHKHGYNQNDGGNGNKGHKALKGGNVPNSVKVIQLTLKGEYIRTWECISDASRELKILISGICACCLGYSKSYKGYIWKYEYDYDNYLKNDIKIKYVNNTIESSCSKVVQLDLKGKFINEFNSIKEASNYIEGDNSANSAISACCNKASKSSRGYQWYFKSEYEHNIKNDISMKYTQIVGNKNSKEIVQFDLNGEYIKEYSCLPSIMQINTTFDRSGIIGCCKKNKKSANGFLWAYKEDYIKGYLPKYQKNYSNARKIVRLSIDGEYINTYDSISDAKKDLDVKTIRIYTNEHPKSTKGFLFVYDDEYDTKTTYEFKKESLMAKKVVQLTMKREFIREYSSLTKATKQYDNVNLKGISKCVNKGCKSHGGFIWIFAEEYYKYKL